MAMLKLPALAGFLAVPGIVALLLAGGGYASAQAACAHFGTGYERGMRLLQAYNQVTVSVSEASVVDTYSDTVHVEWSLGNEDRCISSLRSGYCLKVTVHGSRGDTHEMCRNVPPRTNPQGFEGKISLGPAYWRLQRITAHARVRYGSGDTYTSWSPGYPAYVRFGR